jgi:hypothetical protein
MFYSFWEKLRLSQRHLSKFVTGAENVCDEINFAGRYCISALKTSKMQEIPAIHAPICRPV